MSTTANGLFETESKAASFIRAKGYDYAVYGIESTPYGDMVACLGVDTREKGRDLLDARLDSWTLGEPRPSPSGAWRFVDVVDDTQVTETEATLAQRFNGMSARLVEGRGQIDDTLARRYHEYLEEKETHPTGAFLDALTENGKRVASVAFKQTVEDA